MRRFSRFGVAIATAVLLVALAVVGLVSEFGSGTSIEAGDGPRIVGLDGTPTADRRSSGVAVPVPSATAAPRPSGTPATQPANLDLPTLATRAGVPAAPVPAARCQTTTTKPRSATPGVPSGPGGVTPGATLNPNTTTTARRFPYVEEADLPAPPAPPAARTAPTAAVTGKGMWVWKYRSTESGNPDAMIARAKASGVASIWVRVGDTKDGFYAAKELEELVPKAHAAGLKVIGWGFPFLHDPMADARWTQDAATWRSRSGERLDGFSPDLETQNEGVVVTEKRVALYLGWARQVWADRPVVGTVYIPNDTWWSMYPYRTVAPYIDVFAPMVYWGCREPDAQATLAVQRLKALAPVAPVGQAYNQKDEGGVDGLPPAAEVLRFTHAARREGAIGVSFWVWQQAPADTWEALARYPWEPATGRSPAADRRTGGPPFGNRCCDPSRDGRECNSGCSLTWWLGRVGLVPDP